MPVVDRATAQAQAILIRDETTLLANTAERVGGTLLDIVDSAVFPEDGDLLTAPLVGDNGELAYASGGDLAYADEVKTGGNYLALGADPATFGALRLTHGEGGGVWAFNQAGTDNVLVAGMLTGADTLLFGGFGTVAGVGAPNVILSNAVTSHEKRISDVQRSLLTNTTQFFVDVDLLISNSKGYYCDSSPPGNAVRIAAINETEDIFLGDDLSATNVWYGVKTGGSHFFRVNEVTEMALSATQLDIGTNDFKANFLALGGAPLGGLAGVVHVGNGQVFTAEWSDRKVQMLAATEGGFVPGVVVGGDNATNVWAAFEAGGRFGVINASLQALYMIDDTADTHTWSLNNNEYAKLEENFYTLRAHIDLRSGSQLSDPTRLVTVTNGTITTTSATETNLYSFEPPGNGVISVVVVVEASGANAVEAPTGSAVFRKRRDFRRIGGTVEAISDLYDVGDTLFGAASSTPWLVDVDTDGSDITVTGQGDATNTIQWSAHVQYGWVALPVV